MFSVTCFRIRFTHSKRMFLLTLLAMAFFIRLGVWQLERAHEKERLLSASQAQSLQSPMQWQAEKGLPTPYQSIKISGRFLSMLVLLDNQHYQHQFGYDVLSPLLLDNGEVVLIDRGWVLADAQRSKLPAVQTVANDVVITGYAYYPANKQWALGPILEQKNQHTVVVEYLNLPLISQFLHKSVYPFIIRLNKSDPNGYVCEWPIVSMPPAKHYGYAVQWFAIACLVFVIFIGLGFKRR